MALTAATVARHELVGLETTVTAATNPDLEGTSGRVVRETTNTLDLEDDSRVRTVPKESAQFAFVLPGDSEATASDGASGDEPRTVVTVDGEKLVARPARRTEQRGDSRWR